MRRFVWALCLLMTSYTASTEINFLDNPAWSNVIERAKKENKMIFLDAYATWCGPCKKMDAETYKDKAVAEYYNANFVNVKYDMEKGEGVTLAQKYLVTAYPSLLFISPDGLLLHKGVGFNEADGFLTLGKTAKNPDSQYYTLKKNALNLSNTQFLAFAESAQAFEDEDFDELANKYLAKQADILANPDLIRLVMQYVNTLPAEKNLAYIISNQSKIIDSQLFSAADVEEKIISLTLGYALSPEAQQGDEGLDLEVVKAMTEKYIPEKSFFVFNYFKIQFAINEKKIDDAIATLGTVLASTPAKITFDQACNVMMGVGPILMQEDKLENSLKTFEAIKLSSDDAKNVYMKNYVKAIIYLKGKNFNKFKESANLLIADKDTPLSVKEDVKLALERIK